MKLKLNKKIYLYRKVLNDDICDVFRFEDEFIYAKTYMICIIVYQQNEKNQNRQDGLLHPNMF